ncbi:U4/U6 small nuclear ribonucleoprotein Prp3-like [Tropilaelaps mercedesae]|uniref:U4/U6 small nuclear ribonucleoprotein Prp3-like n=1 Tax=Tropilaelaps mercedesae TaxID=418985 RepID=A0A1V9XUZ6_9ACAR|nr:U4/U6 small nuclear ribonucleoprotein Prp3-like [Tropilaelaps mercedesae]
MLKRSSTLEDALDAKRTKPGASSGGGHGLDIKAMMEQAKRQIEEKKRQLAESHNRTHVPSPSAQTSHSALSRIEQLKAQIEARAAAKVIPAMVARMAPPPPGQAPPQPVGPSPVVLDSDGCTRDALGREVKLPSYQPTSLANIRKIKQDKFQQISTSVKEEPQQDASFFDARVPVKPAGRSRRTFKFVEKGKYEQLAEKLRTKAKLEKLQSDINSVAKRTGIQSATTLALIVPKKEMIVKGETPEIEWWDSLIVESYYEPLPGENTVGCSSGSGQNIGGVTNLVEHPIQMRAPTDPGKPPVLPVFLTKKERKKLRRQNRREVQKEKMERVRLGLEPPPEPKVKMSNMMRVLGQQQVADPTKVEAHVREQMAKRQREHEQANKARKLTDEQRREKKTRKIHEDTSLGVHVSLYRLLSLASQSKRFKVETNAKQLQMTGCVLLFRNVNLVAVEGGPKQQAKFRKLMLSRIKWGEDQVSKDGTDQGEKVNNECVLVWEGQVKTRSFGEVKVKSIQTEVQAREMFKKHNVEQYWDLGYSTTVLALAEHSS